MYERMLDKSAAPTLPQIREYLGNESFERLMALEDYLKAHYQLTKALKFPFGNHYGWCYQYGHKTAHLCYAFFENGAFTVMLQIGDKEAPLVEAALPSLLPQTQALWNTRYPCGAHGGWMHYRILEDAALADVYRLLMIKKKHATHR